MMTSKKISRKLQNVIVGLALVAVLTISAWLCGTFNGAYVQRWIDERQQAQRKADAKAAYWTKGQRRSAFWHRIF